MHLIVISDIFGKTACLEQLITPLKNKYCHIDIIDPYSGNEIYFCDEQEAYRYFQSSTCLDNYAQKIVSFLKIKNIDTACHLLGFSMGGSALWQISPSLPTLFTNNIPIKGCCFYSSQIRHLRHIQPKIDMELFFPKIEPSFDVHALVEKLEQKEKVTCRITDYLHGFMNQKSIHYSPMGAAEYLDKIFLPD